MQKNIEQRGDEISERLNKLAWNGKFFTHFIDEDSTCASPSWCR